MKISTSILQYLCIALMLLSTTTLSAQGWERLFEDKSAIAYDGIHPSADGGYWLFNKNGLLKLDANGFEQAFRPFSDTIDFYFPPRAHFTDDEHLLFIGPFNNPSKGRLQVTYAKSDLQGNILWKDTLNHIAYVSFVSGHSIDEFPDRSILISGQISDSVDYEVENGFLMKVDSNGLPIWQTTFGNEDPNAPIHGVGQALALDDGSLVVVSYHEGPLNGFLPTDQCRLTKFDANGQLLWAKTYGDSLLSEHGFDMIQTADGGFAIFGEAPYQFSEPQHQLFVLKVDANGNQQWYQSYQNSPTAGRIGNARGWVIKQTPDGGYIVGGGTYSLLPFDAFAMRLDPLGNEIWYRNYRPDLLGSSDIYGILNHPDGGFVLLGKYGVSGSNRRHFALVAKTDTLGYSITNHIQGNVFNDENFDCGLDSSEVTLSYWPITIEGKDNVFTLKSSEAGQYQMSTDTGDYTVQLHPLNPYWEVCQPLYDVRFDNFFDSTDLDLGAEVLVDCPLLSVGVCAGVMRRCFQNNLSISYRNTGTADADSAYIEVEFDDYLIIDSTSIPIASQNGQLYRFDIGTIPYNSGGRIRIYYTVSCEAELGQTHCINTHIYPDSICLPTPYWSGASVEVAGECQGDSLELIIRNVGSGDMIGPLPYYIVVDDVILRSDDFNLQSGDALILPQMPAGATVRLQATQEPGHPGNSQPSIAFEGCGGPPASRGFFNMLPENDADHFVDIFCAQNRGSYDPNDKQALPVGFGPEHFIKANQDIEYTIRFQNTGTDTAFRVVILDTLPPELDALSIEPNASSHDYRFELYGQGIAKFTFDNILLPDSNVNLLGSQGFVQFRIKQKVDNPLGTVINNKAAIYFDFNSPIITNTTWHTIGEDFIPEQTVSTQQVVATDVEVSVAPNPFSSRTRFEVKGSEGPLLLRVYDLKGRQIQQQWERRYAFTLDLSTLSKGIYFYEIYTLQEVLARGKLMLH